VPVRYLMRVPGGKQDDDFAYDWERDFPLNHQEDEPNGQSTFRFEFELTAAEANTIGRLAVCSRATLHSRHDSVWSRVCTYVSRFSARKDPN